MQMASEHVLTVRSSMVWKDLHQMAADRLAYLQALSASGPGPGARMRRTGVCADGVLESLAAYL